MRISRRNLLGGLAASTLAGAAFRTGSNLTFAETPATVLSNSAAGPIFLSRNENPYGPSQKVLTAMQEALSESNRYPRTEPDSLVNKIAALHRVKPEQIILGCGSSEILCLIASATLSRGNTLIQASPTYPVLGEFARVTG